MLNRSTTRILFLATLIAVLLSNGCDENHPKARATPDAVPLARCSLLVTNNSVAIEQRRICLLALFKSLQVGSSLQQLRERMHTSAWLKDSDVRCFDSQASTGWSPVDSAYGDTVFAISMLSSRSSVWIRLKGIWSREQLVDFLSQYGSHTSSIACASINEVGQIVYPEEFPSTEQANR